jgi:hypothetical protein
LHFYLEANPRRTEVGYVLDLKLRNVSTAPLQLFRYELPWGNTYSLDLMAFNSRGQPLSLSLPIDDPAPPKPDEPITVSPGDTLQGTYELFGLLGGSAAVTDTLARGPVTVIWAYKSPDDNFACASGVATLLR